MSSSRSQSLQRSLVLRSRAASMRPPSANAAEQALWCRLRQAQLGAWFRRQVVLQGYIVDFYACAQRLVVEVDGGYPVTPARQRADARRDRRLAKAGIRVVRLEASKVLQDLEAAVAVVRAGLRV